MISTFYLHSFPFKKVCLFDFIITVQLSKTLWKAGRNPSSSHSNFIGWLFHNTVQKKIKKLECTYTRTFIRVNKQGFFTSIVSSHREIVHSNTILAFYKENHLFQKLFLITFSPVTSTMCFYSFSLHFHFF